ncbi:Outer membrane protein [Fimbriiglobus ruber]|uniref:Outer membrane protein n=1 Tax=Fimbriiglobus ruber TaxID=1908690 RepID=A0A225DUN3_9BACT|nr:Outer membrane protein [Fimbriiglobus ruber]
MAFAQPPQPPQPPALSSAKPVEKVAAKSSVPEAPPGTILQPGENPIDLGTALRLAGVENPELLLARQRISQVTAERQLAVAQLLPNLNLGTNIDMHTGAVQQSTGNILNVNRDALYFGLGANAVGSGTVNIPGLAYNMNVGETWYGFLTARQRVRTADATAAAVQNDVLLRVSLAYTELLRFDGHRAIAAKNRAEAAEVARLTKNYAEAGQGRKADADRASVELRQRDIELIQAEADTLTASAHLCQLLNLDPSTRLKPIDGWVVPAPIVPDPIPLTELLAIAMMQRPELAARRSEVRTALYELSLARVLPFSPNVIAGFSSGDFGGGSNLVSNPPGFVNGSGQLTTGPRFGNFDGRVDIDVVVFWTFRNMGVGNLALIRSADSRVKQIKLREIETLNVVRAEVAEAHARVAARFLQIDSAEKAARAGKDAYDEDLIRIKGGQGLPLELLDSFRLLARARYEYLDTIIDYNRAQVQLWVSLGRPPADALARPVPADLVPPPSGPRVPDSRVLTVIPGIPTTLPVKP